MSGSSALWNPAGGLRYHLRAYRYSETLWQPFRWALGEWLLGWEPPEKTLVMVGPSGGYTTQPFLFERFERLICLEPDPVARFVFKRRLARAPLESRPTLEFITDDRLVHHPDKLVALLETLGDAAVLFSNILGQVRVLLGASSEEEPAFVRVREEVRRALANRSYASYHDRVSGHPRPEGSDKPMIADDQLSNAELVESLYPADTRVGEDAELLDHFTQGFFPRDLEHAYFVWELEPGWFHLIEGVRHQANLGG